MKIDDFINHFAANKDIFLHGECYWFAQMLYNRFSVTDTVTIYYNPIDNHFACLINNQLYDASGAIPKTHEWVPWRSYINTEPLGAARVYRDCIWHYSFEDWNNLPDFITIAPWRFDILSQVG